MPAPNPTPCPTPHLRPVPDPILEDDVLDTMERQGGGFVSALAVAWRKADPINRAKLREAFPAIFQHYRLLTAGELREALKGARQAARTTPPTPTRPAPENVPINDATQRPRPNGGGR